MQITAAYQASEEAALAKARQNGATIADGDPLLQDRIRSFADSDLAKVTANAEARFGITDAPEFAMRLKELFDKYATLLAPPLDEEDGAARVLDPVFSHLLDGAWLTRGKLWKDYRVTPW